MPISQKRLRAEIAKRRAFAIIAHPDAGKTTLTEKLLLYGGAIHLAGHVRARKNRPKTRSDWMKMEQERGISVTSAALQFSYQGYCLNLLDTPGHEDFSEDTYRTLMAVDAAVMLLDGSKGVEAQTIKLFQICQERKIPIATFINKMDRPTKDPFALLDEIEKIFHIRACPLFWPIASGSDFQGVYDIRTKLVHCFEKGYSGSRPGAAPLCSIEDLRREGKLEQSLYEHFKESIELAQAALTPFDQEAFLSASLSPVFFGSAVKNFGVAPFLENFIHLAPPPPFIERKVFDLNRRNQQPAQAQKEKSDLCAHNFGAFVFKLQANMNQKHRDRIAFVRIVRGAFERGMSVYHQRLKKTIRMTNPVAFFGQERSTIDEAFPGDIIGLSNPGIFRIGDMISYGPSLNMSPIPCFAPELFVRLRAQDTRKLKAFRRGLQELAEEGLVQLFHDQEGQNILGAVGRLQFESFQFRLEDEYGAACVLENLPYECSRWFHQQDKGCFSNYDMILYDSEKRPLVLFRSAYRIKSLQAQHPKLELLLHPP